MDIVAYFVQLVGLELFNNIATHAVKCCMMEHSVYLNVQEYYLAMALTV